MGRCCSRSWTSGTVCPPASGARWSVGRKKLRRGYRGKKAVSTLTYTAGDAAVATLEGHPDVEHQPKIGRAVLLDQEP